MKQKHFAGLDGLRFISITFVVLHHLFTFKSNFGFDQFDYPILGLIGFYGIQFFFMGSGFLITYLLLSEHQSYGRISLKNFLLRRILRIWPAYYLLILLFLIVLKLSFFRIPGTTDAYLSANYVQSNSLYLIFLPHIQPFLFPTGPYVHHTYTIGIEEQFYILWGLLFYFFKKYMYYIFLFILLAMLCLNFLHVEGYGYLQNKPQTPHSLQYFFRTVTYLQYSRFSTFAIGSLFGYAYFHQKKWINYFKLISVQLLVYIVLFFSIYYQIHIPYVDHEYMAFLAACVLLMATFKNESLINYSAGWISYLGKISYGIYLFHIFAIVFACKLVSCFFDKEGSLLVTFFLCLSTLILSIVFGGISYHYYESYFLKLKQRFRQPSSGLSSKHKYKNEIVHEK